MIMTTFSRMYVDMNNAPRSFRKICGISRKGCHVSGKWFASFETRLSGLLPRTW